MPVVLAVMLGVVKVNDQIAPDPDDRTTEVEPVIVPAPVMVPDAVAVSVSVVPEMLEFTTMLPPFPVASSDSPAEAVIVPEVVIVVAAEPGA